MMGGFAGVEMKLRNREKSLFLFSDGRDPASLRIGDLALRDYPANLATPPHQPHRALSPAQEKRYTSRTRLRSPLFRSGFSGYGGSDRKNLYANETIEMDLSWSRANEKIIAAKIGTVTELRDEQAQDFLDIHILSDPKTRHFIHHSTLVPDLNYYLTLKFLPSLRRPKLWMLTAIYTLQDATLFSLSNPHAKSKGISEVELDGIAGMKVGKEVLVGEKAVLRAECTVRGERIWAVEYTRVDVKFGRMGDNRAKD